MTAKDFTALTTQATTTLADNATRDISAADVRQMVIDHLDSVEEATFGIIGWTTDIVGSFTDLIPKTDGQGIGSSDASPAFVAVGGVGTAALEGIIIRRADSDGGGIALGGFRGDPGLGLDANAPAEIAGSTIILDGGVIGIIVPGALAGDHSLIVKPTIVLPDGRLLAPMSVGPPVVYTNEESTSDAQNLLLVATVTTDVIGGTSSTVALTLVNAYSAGSIVSVDISIEEVNGQAADVNIIVRLSGVPVIDDNVAVNGNSTRFLTTNPITAGAGETLTLEVSYVDVGGGPARQVRVRGDLNVSLISIQG